MLSSATGNQLDETRHKSALKLINLKGFYSRDENQTRNICDKVSLYSPKFSFVIRLIWIARNSKFVSTTNKLNNLLILTNEQNHDLIATSLIKSTNYKLTAGI